MFKYYLLQQYYIVVYYSLKLSDVVKVNEVLKIQEESSETPKWNMSTSIKVHEIYKKKSRTKSYVVTRLELDHQTPKQVC